MSDIDDLQDENRRLKNLVASAGEHFIKRRRDKRGTHADKCYEEAYLETATPIMLQLAKDEEARMKAEDVPEAPRQGQLGQ